MYVCISDIHHPLGTREGRYYPADWTSIYYSVTTMWDIFTTLYQFELVTSLIRLVYYKSGNILFRYDGLYIVSTFK